MAVDVPSLVWQWLAFALRPGNADESLQIESVQVSAFAPRQHLEFDSRLADFDDTEFFRR